MKNSILAGIITLLASNAVMAEERRSYVTEMDENGRYCAVVEIRTIGYNTIERRKCRTITGWQNAGYDVEFRRIEE